MSNPAQTSNSPSDTAVKKLGYSNDFYEDIAKGANSSARVCVPMIIALLDPKSVVDVGCGAGSWLSEFIKHGVTDVHGLDASDVPREQLEIPVDDFEARDLSKPFLLARRFDAAICLEVAEHLPPASAENLVESLTNSAPVVVFSAAIPHQTGTMHINEQWPSYWAQKFDSHGFCCVNCFRPKLWDAVGVSAWYAQNMFLMAHNDWLKSRPDLKSLVIDKDQWGQLNVVHPQVYATSLANPPAAFLRLSTIIRAFAPALTHSIKSRFARRSA